MQANERLHDHAPPPSRALPGARRAQIVQAAADLFGEQGYHGTSMDEIGKRVGLLKGSLYAHVSRKEELLLEIASTAAREFTAALIPVVQAPVPAPEKLGLALAAHLRAARSLGSLASVFLLETRHLEGQPAVWVAEARQRYERLWHTMFQQGVQAGELRPSLDVSMATSLTLAALRYAPAMLPDEYEDQQPLAARLRELLLAGCERRSPP